MNDYYNAEYLSERVAALAQERDDLRRDVRRLNEICERQARLNIVNAKLAMDLDNVTAERDELVCGGRHGRWEKPVEHGLPHKANHLGVVCSYCCSWSDNKYNYCPNCGANMRGE